MPDRKYVVHFGHGRVEVLVREGAIALRGEREAVANAAWLKLLGQNELGEDVDKNSPTRKILFTEMLSRYENQRQDVYEQFKAKVKMTWIGIERDDDLVKLLRR